MSYQERILRVLLYVQDHLDDELSLDHLAGVACFSPYHFHRVFRGMTGEPVKEYIRRLRLERAAQQLKTTADPVTDIAFGAGYEAHESFTRAFHARFGASPSAWRERHTPRPTSPGETQVRIVSLPAKRLAFVRHVGPYPEVGRAWARLFSLAGPARLLGPGLEYFGVLYDDAEITEPSKLRYDAAIAVPMDFHPTSDFAAQTLPAREYAVLTHFGPYSNLSESYARLCGEWLPLSGREPASAPSLEYYFNNPNSTPPDQLVTDIFIPLE